MDEQMHNVPGLVKRPFSIKPCPICGGVIGRYLHPDGSEECVECATAPQSRCRISVCVNCGQEADCA